MKKIILLSIVMLMFSCTSEQKNHTDISKQNTKRTNISSKKKEYEILIDTLDFHQTSHNELIAEKYANALPQLQFYKQFISDQRIAKKQAVNDTYSESEIIYLGKLASLNKQHEYHIISNFKVIKTGGSESPRGFSTIVFINTSLDKIMIFNVNMPDELPIKIENDVLYFNAESEKVGIVIVDELFAYLCIPKIGCY